MKRTTVLLGLLLCMAPPLWAAEEVVSALPEALSENISYDLFDGGRQGYLHPFLELGLRYTDNLFLEPTNRRQDTITVISPGLWLALPASRQEFQPLATLTRAPGGLEVQRMRMAPERRLQGFAFWRSHFEQHRDFPDEDRDSHRLQGALQYQAPAGLYLQATAAFDRNYDDYATGAFTNRQRDRFESTLAGATLGFRPGERLRLALDYSQYQLSYREERSAFRDREDRVWSGTIAYRLLPRTETFVQYRRLDIDYDQSGERDSEEDHYFAGVQWQATAKSRGRLQFGYGDKSFATEAVSRRRDFIAEARVDHRFTERTSIYLQGSRKTNETDITGVADLRSHRLLFGYEQSLTARLRGAARLSYQHDQYRGGAVDGRKDDYYGGGADLTYAARPWLRFTGGYDHAARQAGDAAFDYRRNLVHLGVTATF
jgi:polysaccharide biosynthesis protein VpsM